jgi:hypothetical protein
MTETDWMGITASLNAAGFSVSYERISYEPDQPLWRATAVYAGRQWSSVAPDLETALVELEKQTRESPVDPLESSESPAALRGLVDQSRTATGRQR